jgi:hypothetical protein
MIVLHGCRRATAALAGAALVLVLGCGGDDGYAKRFPVSGTVTLQGQPLEKGQIRFTPVDNAQARAAAGQIESGNYSLTTVTPGDGAIPGTYQVTIVSREVDKDVMTKTSAKVGGLPLPTDVMKAIKTSKRLVPSKYELASTSGLKANVKAESNTIDFDLKN